MKKLTTDLFIERAKSIHGNLYDYSKTAYLSNKKKVYIICNIHGEFFQEASSHLRGAGCAWCFGNKKDTNESFIEKANKIHNNLYNYKLIIYINATTKIKIICNNHGEFLQQPLSHLNGSGCPLCSGNKKDDNESFIEKANKIHGYKYDYSLIDYKNNDTKIVIICKDHGKFSQKPGNHLNSVVGCALCNGNAKATNDQFAEKAIKIHGDKYDYTLVNYINKGTDVIIICSKHGKFLQTPSVHINAKSGCPKCAHSSSKLEKLWLDLLKISDKNRQVRLKINKKNYKLDAYDPITNTIYEFYGDFWHGNPKIYNKNDINKATNKKFGQMYNKTMSRENELRSYGYNLVTIWESDFNLLI